MADLLDKKCVPCREGAEPLKEPVLSEYRRQLDQAWELVEGLRLERRFKFKDFQQALNFVNQVGATAEAEGHHPDICLYNWNRVKLTLFTHKIKGLHENDFILAKQIDRLTEVSAQ